MLFEQRNIVGFSKMTTLPIKPKDKNKDSSCSNPLHAYYTFQKESSKFISSWCIMLFLCFLYKFVEKLYIDSPYFQLNIQMCFVFQLIVIIILILMRRSTLRSPAPVYWRVGRAFWQEKFNRFHWILAPSVNNVWT